MKLNGWIWGAALVLAAACGGDAAEAPAADAGSPAAAAAAPATTPAGSAGTSAPGNGVPPGASAPQPVAVSAPSREDSAAAAAEDVSPEWKQRTREMGSYAHCMRQASGAEQPARTRLEEACSRLPDAP
jgi:hypothetical protein